MKNKQNYLDLKPVSSRLEVSEMDLDSFVSIFQIPQQYHNLIGQLPKLQSIVKILVTYEPELFTKHQNVLNQIQSNLEDNKVEALLNSSELGEKSGLVGTHPIYEALRKIPHSKNKINIFEIVLGLLVLAVETKPDIKPNPAKISNIKHISREIRTKGKPTFSLFQDLMALNIICAEDLTVEIIQEPIQKYLDNFIYLFSNELKALFNHFLGIRGTSNQPKRNSAKSKTKKNKRLSSEEVAKRVTRPSSSKSEIITIASKNDQKAVNELGSLSEDNSFEEQIVTLEQIEDETLSHEGERVAAQAVQKKSIMQAQFCRYRWECLSAIERKTILSKALPSSEIGATCAIFTLAFGAEPTLWSQFKLGRFESSEVTSIDIEKGLWFHPIDQHQNAWQPSENQKQYLYYVQNFVTLSLPKIVQERLGHFDIKPNQTLGALFDLNSDQLYETLKDWLLEVAPRNRQISVARLREDLYSTIMDQTMDEVAAQMISAQPTFLLPVQNFYTAMTQTKLNQIYNQALTKIFSEHQNCHFNSDKLSGSLLQVKPEFFSSFLLGLQQKLKTFDKDDFVTYHNDYTLYTYQVLSVATGHRAIIDPFSQKDDFIDLAKSVIIYDKETDANHMGRACAMGEIAWQQFENYCEHLRIVSDFIYTRSKPLRSGILNALEGKPSIPFLFLLNSSGTELEVERIRPKQLSIYFQNWDLPSNTHRHFLASHLREAGVSSEMIDYHLGHFNNGTQAIGIASSLCLKNIIDHLSKPIDLLLSNLGIEAKKSLVRAKPITKKRSRMTAMKLGYQLRTDNRTQKHKKMSHTILGEVNKVIKNLQHCPLTSDQEKFQEYADDQIEKTLTKLLDHKDIVSRPKAVVLYKKLLARQIKRNNIKLKDISLARKVQQDPSPYTAKTGHDYSKLISIRNHFTKFLSQNNAQLDDPMIVISFTILIEIIYGRLHNMAWIKAFASSLSDGICFENNRAILNLKYKTSESASFSYTCSTLGSLFIGKNQSALTIDIGDANNEVLKTLKQIIQQLNADFFNLSNLAQLLKYASAADAIELPGVLGAICTGKIDNFSLQPERSNALKSGCRLSNDIEPQVDKTRELNEEFEYVSGSKSSFKNTKKSISEIRSLFDDPKQTKQDASQKNRLIDKIYQVLNDQENGLFPIYVYLLQWGVELLTEPEKNRLRKASVINKIIHSNATGLVESIQGRDPLSLTESDFVNAYNKTIQYYPSHKKGTTWVISHLKGLQDFHEFLVDTFGVAEVDFSELDLPETLSGYFVNANYISYQEYKIILDALKNDHGVDNSLNSFQSLAFILAYNSGLRSNELFSLSIKDIQGMIESFDLTTLTVQANRYGILKTFASRRNLPLFIWLDDEEKKFINDFISKRILEGAQPSSPLFSEFDDPFVGDISKIKRLLVYTIRYVTGDSSLRFHHLRHSFATWVAEGLVVLNDSIDPNNPKSIALREHFYFSNSRRGLFQLAEFMGHAHPSTTIINYIHNLDEWLMQYQLNQAAYEIDYPFLTSVTGFSYAQLRQWKSRYGQKIPLVDFCITKLNLNSESLEMDYSEYPTQLPVNHLVPKADVNFRKISWFLSRMTVIKNVEAVASVLNLIPSDIQKLTSAFQSVGLDSGYIPEPLVDFLKTQYKNMPDLGGGVQKTPTQLIDSSWVASLEKVIFSAGCSNQIIQELLKLWIQYVQPEEPSWRLETQEQLKQFIEGLLKTGVAKKAIELKGYENSLSEINELKKIKFRKISPESKHKQARKYLQINLDPADVSIIVVKNELSCVKTMNFYLFLSAVWNLSKEPI